MPASAPPSALVVDPNPAERARTVEALTRLGFTVTGTETFEAARQRMVAGQPAVLISVLKLGEYNGLHLVLRARAADPRTAAIIVSDDGGAQFRREALQAGATFVLSPVAPQDLIAAVLRTMFRGSDDTLVEPPFERRVGERRMSQREYLPNRRAHERRRPVQMLLQSASLG